METADGINDRIEISDENVLTDRQKKKIARHGKKRTHFSVGSESKNITVSILVHTEKTV